MFQRIIMPSLCKVAQSSWATWHGRKKIVCLFKTPGAIHLVIYVDGIRVCQPTVSQATLEACASTYWHFEQLFFCHTRCCGWVTIPQCVAGDDAVGFNFATSVQRMRLQVHINFWDSFCKMNSSVLDKVFGRWSMINDTSLTHISLWKQCLAAAVWRVCECALTCFSYVPHFI
jgi:hypothetical protein